MRGTRGLLVCLSLLCTKRQGACIWQFHHSLDRHAGFVPDAQGVMFCMCTALQRVACSYQQAHYIHNKKHGTLLDVQVYMHLVLAPSAL